MIVGRRAFRVVAMFSEYETINRDKEKLSKF